MCYVHSKTIPKLIGVDNLKKLPGNVQLIDCSATVDAHSAYFTAPSVYTFLKNNNQLLPPGFPQNVKLLADGSIAPITN